MRNLDSWPAILLRAFAVHMVALLIFGLAFVGGNFLLAQMGSGIVFFRGLLALAGAAVICGVGLAFVARGWRGDALSAVIAAACVWLSAFVLGPVTVDRSITVFLLSRFEQSDLGEADARRAFVGTYVEEWRQIERRLSEQERSGHLERVGDRWRLTPQGRSFMEISRFTARLFATDPRFVGLP